MDLKNLYLPAKDSHKGQNGRLLIIGGSKLFHSASLWALKVASRIVDLVHYSSIEENNKIVQKLKEEFRDGIVVPRTNVEDYINEDDCVLIGPGMIRTENSKFKIQNSKLQLKTQNLKEISEIEDEGLQTYYLTKYLLLKYPLKKWVIDAGALQMMDPSWIPQNAILTPHHLEFKKLFGREYTSDAVREEAKKHNCIILAKGEKDIVASKDKIQIVEGGNVGMTKGGTGDVLAGLVAAFYCKNDPFIAAISGSYINKKAGDDLYQKMGYFFNASDLADQIPQTMKNLLLNS